MNKRKAGTILLVSLLLVSLSASAAAAKGGRGGGGGRMGSPSISRQAPAAPSQRQQAAPSRDQSSAGTTEKRNIDQGIDPKDYGKKNAGTGSTAAGSQSSQAAPQNTRSNFFGGGSFFGNGFSFWPWFWISSWFGHGNAAASDGTQPPEEQPQTESLWDSLANWWTNFVSSVKALFGM